MLSQRLPRTKGAASLTTPVICAIVTAIAVACFALYFNALHNGFVYDDEYQVLRNPWIQDFHNLPTLFVTKVWGFQGGANSNYYRPLMHVIYTVDYHLFGFNATGFHAVSVLLHGAVSVLVFFLLYHLLGEAGSARLAAACAATMLFLAHPIQTEAVTPVMSVTELLLATFGLSALNLHMRSSDKGRTFCLPAAFFLFVATLCKETALTLPLIFFAYELTFRRGEITLPLLLKRYLPYVAVVALYFGLRTYAVGAVVPVNRHPELSTYQCLINIFPLLALYLGKLLVPVGLNAKYEFHPVTTLWDPKSIVSLLAVLAAVCAAFFSFRRARTTFFGLALLFVPLLPTLYIRAIPYPFADRYLYLPSVGFVLIIAAQLSRFAQEPTARKGLAAAVVAVFCAYAVGTFSRNKVWYDNYSLWADTVTKSPSDPVVRNNLGLALAKEGRVQEAVEQYAASLRLNPDDDFAHYNLASALARQGRLDEALAHYVEVVRINPGDQEARALAEMTAAQLAAAKGNAPIGEKK